MLHIRNQQCLRCCPLSQKCVDVHVENIRFLKIFCLEKSDQFSGFEHCLFTIVSCCARRHCQGLFSKMMRPQQRNLSQRSHRTWKKCCIYRKQKANKRLMHWELRAKGDCCQEPIPQHQSLQPPLLPCVVVLTTLSRTSSACTWCMSLVYQSKSGGAERAGPARGYWRFVCVSSQAHGHARQGNGVAAVGCGRR